MNTFHTASGADRMQMVALVSKHTSLHVETAASNHTGLPDSAAKRSITCRVSSERHV